MIRHIEMIKINEVVDGKFRAEQLDELKGTIDAIVQGTEGVVDYTLSTRSESLDPMDADLMLMIDFENAAAVDEYELDIDRITTYLEISQNAVAMLVYDYEV